MKVAPAVVFAGLLSIASALSPPRADAGALAAPALHWVREQGAEGCVAPRELSERVENLLGAPLARAAEAEHTVEGRVAAAGRGFRVKLRLSDRAGQLLGERELAQAGDDCAQLTERVAFVVAMMIDPEATAHGLPPALLELLGEDEPEQRLLHELEEAPPKPAPAVHADPAAQLRRERREPAAPPAASARVLLALFGVAAFGQAPGPAALGELLGLFDVAPRLSLGAAVRAGAQLGRHTLADEHRVSLDLAGAAALSCAGHASSRRLRFSGCLGPQLTLRHARGAGFDKNQQSWLASAGVEGRLGLRVRVRRGWGVAFVLAGQLAFPRQRLEYTSPEGAELTAYRFPPAGLSLGVGPSFER